jgi:hypothetical protein
VGPLSGDQTAKRIVADEEADTLWIVALNDRIWSYAGGGEWKEPSPGGSPKDIYVHKGTPYIIGEDARLWKGSGKFGWGKMNVVEPK